MNGNSLSSSGLRDDLAKARRCGFPKGYMSNDPISEEGMSGAIAGPVKELVRND
jgi:hypothetical protein